MPSPYARFPVLLSLALGLLLLRPAQADPVVFSLNPTGEDCGVMGIFDGFQVEWVATCKTDQGTRVATAFEGPDQLVQVQVTGPALDLDEGAVTDLLDKASEIRGQNPGYADSLIDALLSGA